MHVFPSTMGLPALTAPQAFGTSPHRNSPLLYRVLQRLLQN
jgi:hypothetical protein